MLNTDVIFIVGNTRNLLRLEAVTKIILFLLINMLKEENPRVLLLAKVVAFGFQNAHGANRG